MSYITIPAIVVICYIVAKLFKLVFKRKTKLYKGIPILVGVIGGIIGVVTYVVDPTIIGTPLNILCASAVGIISGLASTGIHQAIKQILKDKKIVNEGENKNE